MNIKTFLVKRVEHLRNGKRTKDEIDKLNSLKFHKLVQYVYEHSTYYRRVIESCNIDIYHCTPQDFPILTKKTLMENFDDIVTDTHITKKRISEFLSRSSNPMELYLNKYYVIHTSGSSGEIGFFVFSAEDWGKGIAHSFKSPILSFKKKIRKRIAFYGAISGHYAGVTFASTTQKSILSKIYKTKMFDINSPVQKIIEELDLFQPDVIIGYPSGVKILAERQLSGELHINPFAIQLSGEVLCDSDRKLIEQAFNKALVLNFYSCSEHLLLGYSCSNFGCMYLFEDDIIFDIRENDLLVTNLFNYTLPLIRYQMNDILIPKKDKVLNAKYPYTQVEEIVGRMENAPIFKNSGGDLDFISPHMITEFYNKDLRLFQMQVLDKENFVFKVVLNTNIEKEFEITVVDDISQKLNNILKNKNLENVKYKVDVVDNIEISNKTGKFKLIV